jgi:membrane protein DedA with SNARE-associated domain
MRKRLYFLLPDFQRARRLLDEMLLARVEIGHVHFLAKRDTLPSDLPEAGVLQKTDIVHGAEIGLVIGGSAGIVLGGLLVMMPPGDISLELVTVLITGLLGAGFGAWVSGMIGTQVANSRLKAFHADIDRGKTLMMVDVQRARVAAIRELVMQRHPEAVFGGLDPTIPAFP